MRHDGGKTNKKQSLHEFDHSVINARKTETFSLFYGAN